jgi:murein DD-endopeptidase MepM/ murein hydrolase activator NlpD
MACTYTVQPGDWLSRIAPSYGASWSQLAQWNNLADPNLIYPGQVLVVCPPDTAIEMSAPAPQPANSVPAMIAQVFGAYAPQALAVARCESGYNPGAWNPTPVWDGEHAQGVFQIIPSTYARSGEGGSVWNAWDNINAAYRIFARDGYSWREWACKP